MKTLISTSQKGGAGKSTLARNLAVAAVKDGARVLALDLDPQRSLRAWWHNRAAEDIVMLENDPHPNDLARTLREAKWHGFDYVIVDTPPSNSGWLSAAMSQADLVMIPVGSVANFQPFIGRGDAAHRVGQDA